MKSEEICRILEEITGEAPATISPQTEYSDLSSWDSVAVVSFISVVDEKYGMVISAKDLSERKTVKELAEWLKDREVADAK